MASSNGTRRDRKGILVVDDEKLVRWSIREALRGQYRIWTAESAERALRMLDHIKHLDGVLVDIRLPGVSGYELIRQLRMVHPELKVFVMTAFDQESAPRQAFSVRADGYLSKPFSMETLRDMLASHLMTVPSRPEKVLNPAGNRRASGPPPGASLLASRLRFSAVDE